MNKDIKRKRKNFSNGSKIVSAESNALAEIASNIRNSVQGTTSKEKRVYYFYK